MLKRRGPGGNNNLPGGAVAGVAIGCLIAGAAIAGIVLFLLFRRKRNQHVPVHHHQVPYNSGPSSVKKGPVVATTAVAGNVDNLIPQPVDDDAITNELSRIRDNIKNHMHTYYRFDPIGPVDIGESQLALLSAATGVHASAILDSLLSPSRRADAIRLIIAWEVFSRCEGNKHPSFLPAELAPLAVAILGKDGRNSVQSTLYSKWKTITGLLLQQQYSKQAQDTGAHSHATSEAIAQLNIVLSPFIQGSVDGGQRHRNLEMIMSRAAGLAFLLFSQPGSFHFDFSSRGGLVVFPRVQQVIGDDSQVINPPRVLWEKEYAAETGV